MINPKTDELKLIAEKRGIKDYQNMSRKKLLRSLNKSELNFKNTLLKRLDQIAKCKIFHKMKLSKSQE